MKQRKLLSDVFKVITHKKSNDNSDWTLTPSQPSLNAPNMAGEIQLFLFYYGVKYIISYKIITAVGIYTIFFSCLFETFATMSEIMFSSDSRSKKNFNN